MHIDISDVPFSRYGSYMSLNILPAEWNHPGVALRSMRTGGGVKEAFNLIPTKNADEIECQFQCTAAELRMSNADGVIRCCYEDTDVLRIHGKGIALRIRSCAGHKPTVFQNGEDSVQVICSNESMYSLIPISGEYNLEFIHHVRRQDKKQSVPEGYWFDYLCGCDGGEWELVIHDYETQARTLSLAESYKQAHKDAKNAWTKFLKLEKTIPKHLQQSAQLAQFVNYTSVIGPNERDVRRDTMLMSKNWMCRCWSWDHCINAIAHAHTHPELAWDLFQGPFDHQNSAGCLPDSYGGGGTSWSFTKPPIHGWTLSCMLQRNNRLLKDPKRAALVEKQLASWTNWWLKHRDTDHDGLPEYRHGNDSGWDNATVYDLGYPMCSPDLPAYLILQMDMLATLAKQRGKEKKAKGWRKQADQLLATMIEYMWNGEQFESLQGFSHEKPQEGDSLINFIPIILGKRLPKTIREKLINALKPDGRFITKNGPATESPLSPLYVADGYWRGPIWGPETVMIVDGLYRAGATKQAKEIARRYCAMCKQDNCMAENYNAESGTGLRDRAYTWGSSAFLFCAALLKS